jgi:pimeloyl-ACP methyl ester carboxylesterase
MATLLRQDSDGRWRWKQDRRRAFDYASILAQVAVLDRTCSDAGLPVMLARGGRSRVLDAAAAERFVAAVPGSRLITIAGAGHNVQEDNPADLAAALADDWTGRA